MHWAFLMQINLLFLNCFLSSFTSRPLTTDNFFVHSLSFSLFVCFTLLFLIQSVVCFFFTHSVYLFFIRSFFFLVFLILWAFFVCSVHFSIAVCFAMIILIFDIFGKFCTLLYICLFCPGLSDLMGNLCMFNTLFYSCFFCPLLSHSLSIFCKFCKLFFHLFVLLLFASFERPFSLHLAYFPCQLLLPSSPLSDGHFL